MKQHLCPICGKPMTEQKRFKGLWMCPDYQQAINDSPPYQYKCTGMILTEKGSKDLSQAIRDTIARTN